MQPKPDRGVAAPSPSRGSRAAELALVTVFLALVASGLLIQTAVELRQGEGLSALEVFQQKPTSANLRAYERRLEDASVVARALRPWFQFAQFAWLHDGGEKALVGRDGWLFYKPGCDALLARAGVPANPTNDPVAAILAWRDALAARGVHLLVVPAPNKESVYPDRLTRRVPVGRSVMSPSTRDVLARLKAANAECVDLFTLFAEARTNTAAAGVAPLYLAQDSHWSPAGADLAAKAVAQRLVEKGWVKPGHTDYRDQPASVERLGDVLRMLQSARIERAAAPERISCVQVIRNDTGQTYQDDTNSEVLVLGDSFLRIYQDDQPGSAGFIARLAKELKQPLTSLISDGGASTLVRQELHRRPSLLKSKRVVVWEFVERDLRLGTEGWQPVPLPPESSAGLGQPAGGGAHAEEPPRHFLARPDLGERAVAPGVQVDLPRLLARIRVVVGDHRACVHSPRSAPARRILKGKIGSGATGTTVEAKRVPGKNGEPGIAALPSRCYDSRMKTLTMKVPDGLLGWLENEAKRAGQPKSVLVREILQQHQRRRRQSALDLAADLCGCVQSGLGDLARNKRHLKGFGR